MARPIKETPVLKGKDAERFSEQIKKNERTTLSKAELQKAVDNYEKVKKLIVD